MQSVTASVLAYIPVVLCDSSNIEHLEAILSPSLPSFDFDDEDSSSSGSNSDAGESQLLRIRAVHAFLITFKLKAIVQRA